MAVPRNVSALFVLLFGALSLAIKLSSPRVRAIGGADLLALVGGGACLGAGLILVLDRFLRSP